MSRSRSSRAAALVLGLLAAALPAAADALLDVSGDVLATAPQLEVRVLVTNRGDQPAAPVEVTGELLGAQRTARIPVPLAPGASGSVVLAFDGAGAPAGVHALTLLLEHALPGPPDGGGNPPLASQRAWLLVALGAAAAPAVKLDAAPVRLAVQGPLDVAVVSADGAAHRVRVRALTARGVRSEPASRELEVPASGAVHAAFTVVRSGAARGTRHGVLLVAESLGLTPVRTSVAVASVEIEPDHAWLPRARKGLLAVALLLLAVVVAVEFRRARARPPEA